MPQLSSKTTLSEKKYNAYRSYASKHKSYSANKIFNHFKSKNMGIKRQTGLKAIAEGKEVRQKENREKYIPKKYLKRKIKIEKPIGRQHHYYTQKMVHTDKFGLKTPYYLTYKNEKQRRKIIKKICVAYELNQSNLTFSDIIRHEERQFYNTSEYASMVT